MALGPFYVAQKLSEAGSLRGLAILTRHGETAWNRDGRVMGRQPVPLSERGIAQVQAAVEIAKKLKPELIFTSPLRRARQTAEIISEGLGGIEIIDEPQLEEVRYGRWEGMTYKELLQDEDYLLYKKSPLTRRTPGGETIADVQARGREAVFRALAQHSGRRLLFVSHGDIIRTLLCHFMGLDLANFHRIRVDNAAFSGVEIIGDFAEIKFLNLLADPERAFIPPFQA